MAIQTIHIANGKLCFIMLRQIFQKLAYNNVWGAEKTLTQRVASFYGLGPNGFKSTVYLRVCLIRLFAGVYPVDNTG